MSTATVNIQEAISAELRDFITSRAATFACGGAIPLNENIATKEGTGSFNVPIVLRWDAVDSASGISKITFPIDASNNTKEGDLQKLMSDSQPAKFGFKGENVLDETYRKAAKIDRSNFSVDFCPYEMGIVDTIAQVLLPNAELGIGTKGVKAELYKLNIYAAPSGMFKAHVDTPRSETQFGSLVVSLPCYHQGGQLVVRHADHSMTFDWASSDSTKASSTSIQWAAFYSDCEHEVLEVTDGHRVTLTYNLYFAPGLGDLAGNSPAMNTESLPLYRKITEALNNPNYMEKGGHLGIYCQHAYAHSTVQGAKSLPSVLKGTDMAVYNIFLALGLPVSVRPVLQHRDGYRFEDHWENYEYWTVYGVDREGYENHVKNVREKNVGMFSDTFSGSFVGNLQDGVIVTRRGGYDGDDYRDLCDAWGGKMMDVTWINQPILENRDIGMAHLTYGNEAGIDYMYTSAALIVDVPGADSRKNIRK